MQDARRKFRVAVGIYLVGIAMAVLFPIMAVVFYFGVALFLLLPFHALRLALSGLDPD